MVLLLASQISPFKLKGKKGEFATPPIFMMTATTFVIANLSPVEEENNAASINVNRVEEQLINVTTAVFVNSNDTWYRTIGQLQSSDRVDLFAYKETTAFWSSDIFSLDTILLLLSFKFFLRRLIQNLKTFLRDMSKTSPKFLTGYQVTKMCRNSIKDSEQNETEKEKDRSVFVKASKL
ncbi:hypothetical protein GQX74_014026 [Glossina fuscipes]|nr:hypothetical protein GQX74_014026 [Glossina fuscipes]